MLCMENHIIISLFISSYHFDDMVDHQSELSQCPQSLKTLGGLCEKCRGTEERLTRALGEAYCSLSLAGVPCFYNGGDPLCLVGLMG